jgi:hypothetical protein
MYVRIRDMPWGPVCLFILLGALAGGGMASSWLFSSAMEAAKHWIRKGSGPAVVACKAFVTGQVVSHSPQEMRPGLTSGCQR